MRVILQGVNKANVIINDQIYNEIETGYMLLVGIGKDDNEEKSKAMAKKISKLRVFKDENDKTNLDIYKVNGKILSISQFTLYANTNEGNRPSFVDAADKEKAIHLYNFFNDELRKLGIETKTGVFGEYMKVNLENDGPFTIFMEM